MGNSGGVSQQGKLLPYSGIKSTRVDGIVLEKETTHVGRT